MSEIYHIRKPLLPARGNQFYADKRFRGQGTWCGAPESLKDQTHKSKAQPWFDEEGREWRACHECLNKRTTKQ